MDKAQKGKRDVVSWKEVRPADSRTGAMMDDALSESDNIFSQSPKQDRAASEIYIRSSLEEDGGGEDPAQALPAPRAPPGLAQLPSTFHSPRLTLFLQLLCNPPPPFLGYPSPAGRASRLGAERFCVAAAI
ncbi:hypothetical protein Q5P01_015719 [Channa striata]|uniref:Uncharacterized protein n=1 Tax=Channa striata TaxID=64152 RepID=A0AA88MCC9_CHASR|nr:hypothetical protein Q5P01_015719 [Channa striata]